MALYLVQHGKSFPKEQDPSQGLTPEGVADVKRIASVARGYGVRVARIEHSGKARAQQTADLFAEALQPSRGVHERRGLNPLDDVSKVVRDLEVGEDLMLVGHLPFMERLTAFLVTGMPEGLILKFQNGGIVCLDQDRDNARWFIRWTLMPKIG